MKYKWIFVKDDKGEYTKTKRFVLEEKDVEKPKRIGIVEVKKINKYKKTSNDSSR